MTRSEARRYAKDPATAQRDALALLKRKSIPKAPAPRNRTKQAAREGAPAHQRKVYRQVDKRSGGHCETETESQAWACSNSATEHDHFWGRGKATATPENVWHLCQIHHVRKTLNQPGRVTWLKRFRLHCWRHGFREEVAKIDRALALETAQHPEARAAGRKAAP